MAKNTSDSNPVSARLSPDKISRAPVVTSSTTSNDTNSDKGNDADKDTGNALQSSRKGVQSVEHAMTILQCFTSADRELAIKDISAQLGMPASKIHHYLVSLVRTGVLRQTDSGAYDLGAFALQLGLSSLRRCEPIELAVSTAKKLRDDSGEATFISVWGSYGATIIRYFEGFQAVTVEVRAGFTLPLATSATGKVFLTWGNETQLEPAMLREKTSEGSVSRIRKETRQRGLGCVDGELLPRIASLSAPVFDQDGKLVLAITQLGWSGEFDTSPDSSIAAALARSAAMLSTELGYSH